ncbi:hypothetical protein BJ878DRAFT_570661 [Calycina marina]|uniref:Uncharacterized protein n=1 Tax=Calycina marina TaxID=1763456 RepID=A0A9P7YWC4_9HELO|nr:hypothetical protein BJ878DRAFT_570661 [Calycina marina]
MPSAFHTFKLIPMAPANNNNRQQPAPILPPSTPSNVRPSGSINTINNSANTSNNTPTSESRMNPPSLPRSMMTPARDVRESSVASQSGGSARKPRQNLEERDHILMLKHCYEQRGNFKEGTKAQFWQAVGQAFQNDTGKVLAQMSATVGRLVEARRRQIADWQDGRSSSKPGGELNDKLDEWMEFLKLEDGEAEAERMRQVDHRRKVEEQRKESRRQAIAAEQLQQQQNPGIQLIQPTPPGEMGQYNSPVQQTEQANGQFIQQQQQQQNGYRPAKRRRVIDSRDLEAERLQQEQLAYLQANHPEPPKRVVVEGAMSKEDWRDVMGNDSRLRALETKVERIEVLLTQNNKMLLQLVSNQNKERHDCGEERVPVHLDAEFERDYL